MSTERVAYEEWSDEKLSIAAKQGDREARNALFLRYQERFKRLAAPAKRTAAAWTHGDRSIDAEDVDQELFLIFCGLLDDWESGRTPFVPYVMKTMKWHAFHFVRRSVHARARVRIEHEASQPVELAVMVDRAGGATNPNDELESIAAWREYTVGLRPNWKRWVDLRFDRGMSSAQIAALSGCSRRTVNRELKAAMYSILMSIQEGWQGL